MELPYAMLVACLYEHVCTTHPYANLDLLYLMDHVMVPLSKRHILRIKPDGKRPHLQTPSESSESPFLAQNQEENDPVNIYTLDPIVYIDQLPPIEGGLEFIWIASKNFKKPRLQQPVPCAALASSILGMEPSNPVLQKALSHFG
ncbi:hypothetical protein Tco_0813390 [Tanacetum coccineum]